ncbi:MAG: hypothetical protein A2X94_08440 [Bdellovibrionales bacterium GWB1_55_8]|nr:MAG: hypothetical protein A2X94_08440 [Bdellovibrionales bacterium GWB1_55_8]
MRKLPLARAFILSKLGVKRPYLVSWSATYRCNARCLYCGVEAVSETPELPTDEALRLLDLLIDSGMVALTLTGGECLLRQDIGEIISRVRSRGCIVKINTNGFLVPSRIQELIGVDEVTLSLDGPEEVHDQARGSGSFAKVIRAVEVLRSHQLPTIFNVTMAEHNIRSISSILELCAEHQIATYFQPAIASKLFNFDVANPIQALQTEYQVAMRELITRKEAGERLILNSVETLRHLEQWPKPTPVSSCPAGVLSFRMDPVGNLSTCYRNPLDVVPLRGYSGKKITELPPRRGCRNCWCAQMVELAALNDLSVGAVFNNLRVRL